MRPRVRSFLALTALFVAVTVLMTWPLAPLLRTGVQNEGDPVLGAFLIGWDGHALAHEPGRLFDPPFFHPYPKVLAWAELFFGETLQVLPAAMAGVDPLLLHNLVLFASFVLAAWAAYLLARELGAGPTGAVLAGLIYAFAPYHITHISRLHAAEVQWIPLVFLFLVRFGRTRRLAHAAAAAAFFVVATWSAGNYFVFLYPAVAVAMLAQLVGGPPGRRGALLRGHVLFGAIALVCVVPVLWIYVQVRRDLGLVRDLAEAGGYADDLLDFFRMPEGLLHVARGATWPGVENVAFPGWLAWALGAAAFMGGTTASASTSTTGHGAATDGSPAPGSAPAPYAPAAPDGPPALGGAPASDAPAAPDGPPRPDGQDGPGAAASRRLRVAFGALVTLGGLGWAAWIVRHRGGSGGLVLAFRLAGPLLLALGGRHLARARWLGAVRARVGRMLSSPGPGAVWAVALLVGGAALCLGPDVRVGERLLGPGLHRLFFGRLPGWDGVRVPARAWPLFGLGLAILAGLGAERLLGRLRRDADRRIAAALLGAAVLFELCAAPLPLRPHQIPDRGGPAYAWLRAHPGGALLELPMSVTSADDTRDARFLLPVLEHGHPILNGYSGYYSPLRMALGPAVLSQDVAGTRALLRLAQTRYVVLHRRNLESWDQGLADFVDALADGHRAYADDAVTIWELPTAPPAPPPPLGVRLALPIGAYEGSPPRASLVLENRTGTPYLSPDGTFAIDVEIGAVKDTRVLRRAPLFIGPGDAVLIPFDLRPGKKRGPDNVRWRVRDSHGRELASGTGLLRLDPPHPDSTSFAALPFLRVLFPRIELPALARPAELLTGRLLVENAGSVLWRADRPDGTHFVRLGWDVIEAETGRVVATGRAPLPCDVAPRQQVEIPFRLAAPSEPGAYAFQFDLVDEGLAWFRDRMAGWEGPPVPILVSAAPPGATPRFGDGFFDAERIGGGELAWWMGAHAVLEPPPGAPTPGRLLAEAVSHGRPRTLRAGGVSVEIPVDHPVPLDIAATGPVTLDTDPCTTPAGDGRCLSIMLRRPRWIAARR